MSRLQNAKIISDLGASQWFWQFQLNTESAKLCTFHSPPWSVLQGFLFGIVNTWNYQNIIAWTSQNTSRGSCQCLYYLGSEMEVFFITQFYWCSLKRNSHKCQWNLTLSDWAWGNKRPPAMVTQYEFPLRQSSYTGDKISDIRRAREVLKCCEEIVSFSCCMWCGVSWQYVL